MNKVFVYGTLKDKDKEDDYFVVGTLYDIGPFPGIRLGGVDSICVPGQIITVDEDELAALDVYEGVPRLYLRSKSLAYPTSKDGLPEEVWVYEWNRPLCGLKEISKW